MRAGSYHVISIENFRKELRTLSKKYHSILEDMQALITDLEADPIRGSSLGNVFYKVRLAIASKKSGKSGGARVITNIKVINKTVYLVSIYDKSSKETVTIKELKDFLRLLP